MEPLRVDKPFLMPKPRYYGVRCGCGAYMVLEEFRSNQPRCNRLDRPAWMECDGCGAINQYHARDVIQFTWPPEDAEEVMY